MARPKRDSRRYRRYVAHEFDNVLLYRRLAEHAKGEHREVLLELAAAEERHVRYWQGKLVGLGLATSEVGRQRPTSSTRLLGWLARRFGVRTVVPLLERVEAAERARYRREPEAGIGLAGDELVHAQLVAGLSPAWRTRAAGSLRASVFGVSDGLVSNLALVMGMAGGSVGRDVVLLAGLAGLVAGAGSMAAGEYLSVKSQRELLQGNRPPTTEEMRALTGEGSLTQLGLLMRLRGLDARRVSDILSRGDYEAAAQALAGDEPDLTTIGSPAVAAVSSFAAFSAGGLLPVLPFVFTSGVGALAASAILAGSALFGIGSMISLLTTRPLLRSGARQLAIGALTASGTYLVGVLVDRAMG